MPDGFEVAAVIVTHRSEEPVRRLVTSLREHEPDLSVVIVDSGSPAGPPDVDGARVIALEDNVGYGAACNVGADEAGAVDAYLFLNPDVRLEGPSVSELSIEMANRPHVGVATGPVVDPSGYRVPSAWGPTSAVRAFWFASGWRLPRLRRFVGRWLGRGTSTSGASTARDEMLVDGHVLGGAMMVRGTCFEELDGFDERFFLYWEDADLCERARRGGWQVAILTCTPLVHNTGTSSEEVGDEQRWGWYFDGARSFARKHLDRAEGRRVMTALRLGRKLRR